MQMENGGSVVIIIPRIWIHYRSCDVQFMAYFKIITRMPTVIRYFLADTLPPPLSMTTPHRENMLACENEQLNSVAGVLHNAIFSQLNFVQKKAATKYFLKKSDDWLNLHSHAIYLAETSIPILFFCSTASSAFFPLFSSFANNSNLLPLHMLFHHIISFELNAIAALIQKALCVRYVHLHISIYFAISLRNNG